VESLSKIEIPEGGVVIIKAPLDDKRFDDLYDKFLEDTKNLPETASEEQVAAVWKNYEHFLNYGVILGAEVLADLFIVQGFNSIEQFDMEGNKVMQNSSAVFAETKAQAKNLLGSAKKTEQGELLIADPINKRAIIVDQNAIGDGIIWEYNSDKNIIDFSIAQEDFTINISEVSNDQIFNIKQGTNVVWKNDTLSTVSVYSGETTLDDFNEDPDLNKFGDVFAIEILAGERKSFKLESLGEQPWFIYPDITTAKFIVSINRLSDDTEFYILESDGLKSSYTSQVIKVDKWGNKIWEHGQGELTNPKSINVLNGRVVIGT
tara:strand:+ start:94870 stop:95826 length:957 start_codon:yes stop_codon:yes gene_type:complete